MPITITNMQFILRIGRDSKKDSISNVTEYNYSNFVRTRSSGKSFMSYFFYLLFLFPNRDRCQQEIERKKSVIVLAFEYED